MGVTGLWKLIEPCGKPVPVETLEGKILAVDISIWLHQVVKGFQDNKGSALNNAHLLGLFNRLCKLLYYRVKPVFIFDGCVPQLKRDTIAKRQQQRNKLNTEADRIQALLLQSLAKEKVVQQALGTNAELLLKSPVKRTTKSTRAENSFDELFKLPELPAAEGKNAEHESDNNEESFTSCTDDYTSASATEDSSFDESNPRYAYNANLQSIDVRSQHFKNLPADVRHDILTDIKETRKQSSWGRLHELPSRSDDFSSFQMKRLLKRRAVQESLEQAEQEMGGRTLTYAELCNFFNEEGIITPTAIAEGTKQISSDENTRYLLVRDLKKKITKPETDVVKCEPIKEEPETIQETKNVKIKSEDFCKDELGDEFDEDLNLAIALSLEETQVYNENDYDYDSDQDLRLNREQSKQLRNAAKGPARAYMIEYGGMNEDEVENIMEKTQRGDINDTAYLERLLDISAEAPQTVIDDEEKPTSTSRLKANLADAKKANELESQELNLRVSDESDSDSDLVEVPDEAEPVAATAQSALAIILDVKKPLAPQEDLFADIFEKTTEKKEKPEDHFVDILEKTTDIKEKVEAIKVMSETMPIADIIEIKDTQEAPQKLELPIEIKDSQDNEDKSKLLPEVKPLVVKPIADNTKMLAILDELKKQTEEVKNIKLPALKQSDSTIEISDDEAGKMPQVKAEIIEICDSDDGSKHATTTATTSKSPLQKTPSKNKTITEFFETAYFIKRTPEKPKEDETSTPPKVKSPFFVKKTPKSARKRAGEHEEQSDEAASPEKKLPKAAKALFEANEPELNEKKEAAAPLNAEDIIKDAAEALKAQKTAEELDELAKTLAAERRELETERNRQDRMGMSISQRMNAECQELLRLFGVPFIVAPMEAEAQCAFLNVIELTNGTITDDSDIWLFGGRTVYKNFFAQNKHVLEFRAEQIEQSFNCDRKKLIQLACLVGSDYTTGVHGIGAVTALEILASFSCSTQDSPPSGDAHTRATIHKVIATLAKFRDWWLAHKNSSLPPGSSARLSLRKKLKNIELHDGFPSPAVIEAYLTPKVDDNKESFSWGIPDVESIREFTRKTFGWTTTKTDEILKPVLKKLNDKKLQGSLLNYFAVKGAVSVRELKVSKRVQTAIDKMSGKIDIETPEKPAKTTRPRRTKRKATIETEEKDGEKSETLTATSGSIVKPTTVEDQPSVSKPRKSARLPNTNEVIPQRERDMEQMRKNKEKAAEILKKSAAQTKKRAAKKS